MPFRPKAEAGMIVGAANAAAPKAAEVRRNRRRENCFVLFIREPSLDVGPVEFNQTNCKSAKTIYLHKSW